MTTPITSRNWGLLVHPGLAGVNLSTGGDPTAVIIFDTCSNFRGQRATTKRVTTLLHGFPLQRGSLDTLLSCSKRTRRSSVTSRLYCPARYLPLRQDVTLLPQQGCILPQGQDPGRARQPGRHGGAPGALNA